MSMLTKNGTGLSESSSLTHSNVDQESSTSRNSSSSQYSLKRKMSDDVDSLHQFLQSSLNFSTPKKICYGTYPNVSPVSSKTSLKSSCVLGRRSMKQSESQNFQQIENIRLKTLRTSSSGNSLQAVRDLSLLTTDSISPSKMQQLCSPKKRICLNDKGNSLYSRHRLGASFSPIAVGAKRKSSIFKNQEINSNNQSPEISTSSQKSGIKGLRSIRTLNNRLHEQFDPQ